MHADQIMLYKYIVPSKNIPVNCLCSKHRLYVSYDNILLLARSWRPAGKTQAYIIKICTTRKKRTNDAVLLSLQLSPYQTHTQENIIHTHIEYIHNVHAPEHLDLAIFVFYKRFFFFFETENRVVKDMHAVKLINLAAGLLQKQGRGQNSGHICIYVGFARRR